MPDQWERQQAAFRRLHRLKGVLRGWEKVYGREALLEAIEEWQNESRLYTTEERALDQRLDRKPFGDTWKEIHGFTEIYESRRPDSAVEEQ